MKTLKKLLILKLFVLALIFSESKLFSQSVPPPPPAGGHGEGGNQPPGGGAPLESGYLLLTMLGTAYGLKKWHAAYRSREMTDECCDSD